jgi:hypothetical protein
VFSYYNEADERKVHKETLVRPKETFLNQGVHRKIFKESYKEQDAFQEVKPLLHRYKSQYTKQPDKLLVIDQEGQKTTSIHPPHPCVLHQVLRRKAHKIVRW